MATQTQIAVRPYRTSDGREPEVRYFPEAASQTFKKGEAVYLNGSGYLAEFTDDIDTGSVLFLGFAAEDGHNGVVGANRTAVWMGNDKTEFIGAVSGASTPSTALTDLLAGDPYPIIKDTTNSKCYVDVDNATDKIHCCLITEIYSSSNPVMQTIADTYGWVIFKLVSSAMQGGVRTGEATE